MVVSRLIESEIERRSLKELFVGSLVRHEDSIGIILDVCTVEHLDHQLGVIRDNKFRILSEGGVHLFNWKECSEYVAESTSPISCFEKFNRFLKNREL